MNLFSRFQTNRANKTNINIKFTKGILLLGALSLLSLFHVFLIALYSSSSLLWLVAVDKGRGMPTKYDLNSARKHLPEIWALIYMWQHPQAATLANPPPPNILTPFPARLIPFNLLPPTYTINQLLRLDQPWLVRVCIASINCKQ